MIELKDIQLYIEENKDRFIEELFNFIRIPSDSSKPHYATEMEKAARFVKQSLIDAGAENTEIIKTNGWPLVFGEKMIDENLPTILIYGHYDVQPAEPLELWESPPYEPEIRDGKIYARGADDDKGQLFMHIKAFEFLMSEDCLPCNVKFIVEGEEETGSRSLEEFLNYQSEKLKADVVLVSDTTINSLENPTITTGLRGLAYFEIELTGANRDLHSGLFGGAVNNPCNILCSVIDKLIDNTGKIAIPGFYDDVIEMDSEERHLLNKNQVNEDIFYGSIGLSGGGGEKEYTLRERLGIRPSCDVNGIWGGYTEKGTKTVLPSSASAKISMRLVPNQEPEIVKEKFENYIRSLIPDDFILKVKYLHGGTPYGLPFSSGEINAAIKALNKTLGKEVLPFKSGGSIPIISSLNKKLGINAVLLGFGLESDAIHAPNENYPLENFYKGIETIIWYIHFFSTNQ